MSTDRKFGDFNAPIGVCAIHLHTYRAPASFVFMYMVWICNVCGPK